MRVRVGCCLVIGALCAVPALSQNLVVNDGFDTDLSGWGTFGSAAPADGTRSFSGNDAGGSATSGSALMTLSSTAAPGTIVGLSQCIDISGQPVGSTYRFFASVDGPAAAQSSESRGILEVAFFSDSGCASPLHVADGIGAVVALVPGSAPPWQTFPGSASAGGNEGSAIAPAGANRLQVRIYLERTGAGTTQQLSFDKVVVHREGTTPVSLTRFAAE